jgi:hypothetical protein
LRADRQAYFGFSLDPDALANGLLANLNTPAKNMR